MNTEINLELQKLLIKKGIDVRVQATIADVVMWLYEKHGIWIYIVRDYDMPKFNYAIQQPHIYSVLSHLHNDFTSPTKAYQEAINYTLKNLIK